MRPAPDSAGDCREFASDGLPQEDCVTEPPGAGTFGNIHGAICQSPRIQRC